jgi:two-component system, cell cycle response regulator
MAAQGIETLVRLRSWRHRPLALAILGVTCLGALAFGVQWSLWPPSLGAWVGILLLATGILSLANPNPVNRTSWLEEWAGGSVVLVGVGLFGVAVDWPFDVYPAVYLVICAALASVGSRAGVALLVFGVCVETMWQWMAANNSPGVFGLGDSWPEHIVLMILAGLSGVAIRFGAAFRQDAMRNAETERRRQETLQRAREFRIQETRRDERSASPELADEMIACDALENIHQTMYTVLRLLQTTLHCHTCVLLWFNLDQTELQIKELVSDSDTLVETGIDPAKGVIGGVARKRQPVVLRGIRSGFRGISYYRAPQGVTDFCGVPVIENGHLRGVVCLDRTNAASFEDKEVRLVEDVARHLMRTIENERVFVAVEKSKNELGRFFEASRRLNSVLDPAAVCRVGVECVGDIAAYDFAAITFYESSTNRHTIAYVDAAEDFSDVPRTWLNRAFTDNSGLVSMSIKNRHYLPFGGRLRDANPVIFTEDEVIEGLGSLLVLPLIASDQPVGTLVIGHRQPAFLNRERREMLEVVGHQIAITLQNGWLYQRMEEMATTDGLTGLLNHRMFQTKADEFLARYRRSDTSFAVILGDIDHFKAVNDTYGHPVGDEVLRRVALTLGDSLRETDIAARYGGEEFAIILEDTDVHGAKVIAERLREEVKALRFPSSQGEFSVTMSIGIGHCPLDATSKEALIDLTDRSLYLSKQRGRDRVTASADEISRAS